MPYHMKYRVVTETSSAEDVKLMEDGRQILFETNNFQQARKECIEWAAYDDIYVEIVKQWGNKKFSCNGYQEATERYPKTAAGV